MVTKNLIYACNEIKLFIWNYVPAKSMYTFWEKKNFLIKEHLTVENVIWFQMISIFVMLM